MTTNMLHLLEAMDEGANIQVWPRADGTSAWTLRDDETGHTLDDAPRWMTALALLRQGWIFRHWEGLYAKPVAVFEITAMGRRVLTMGRAV